MNIRNTGKTTKEKWGFLNCKCGRKVRVTWEVIPVGFDVQTLFEGLCECGRKGSNWYPEQVQRELLGED